MTRAIGSGTAVDGFPRSGVWTARFGMAAALDAIRESDR